MENPYAFVSRLPFVLTLRESEFTPRPGWQYNLSKSLEGFSSVETKAVVILNAGDVASFCKPLQ